MPTSTDASQGDQASIDPPRGYQRTSVGLIPCDWKMRCIGEVGTPVRGGSPRPAGDPRFFNGDFVPWLTVASLTEIPESQQIVTRTASYLTEAGSTRSRTLRDGTLILGNSGFSLGVSKILGITCCANDGIAAILNLKGVDERFLCYVINTQTMRLRKVIARGNDQPNLNTELIAEIPFQCPPLPEQRAIAAALSDVDELIGTLDKLITKKRAIKLATMQQLLTGKTRLPGFEESWEYRRFPEVCWFQEGPGVRNTQFTTSGVKLLNGTNIFRGQVDLDTTNRFISEELAFGQYRHFLADAGDIVIACSGITVEKFEEKVAVLCDYHLPLCMNTSTMRFKPVESELLPGFLLQFLMSSAFKVQIGGQATGSAQLNFGPSHVAKVTLQLPSITEQQAITTVLSDIDAEIAALEQRREKTRSIKQGMMQSLLTGRVRLVHPEGTP